MLGLISITYNGTPVATPRPFLCPIVKLTIPLCWPIIFPSTDFKSPGLRLFGSIFFKISAYFPSGTKHIS